MLARDRAEGAIAVRGDDVVGYVIGAPRGERWGPNMWVEGAGHAASEPEVIRDLYGYLARPWVEAGVVRHSVIVPASDASAPRCLVPAQVSVSSTRTGSAVLPRSATWSRRRTASSSAAPNAADIPVLGSCRSRPSPSTRSRSPVFSMIELPTLEAEIAEWEEGFDDPAYADVRRRDRPGRVVGAAIGCSIDVSSEHRGIVRPANAGFLGFAAVLPEARGLGAGRALGEAVLVWARDAGYPTVVTDWRETNLLSSRAWPRLGFRPIFRRLHRAIA